MKEINSQILGSLKETSYNWAIIHKINHILLGVENDIDIFIEKTDYFNFVNDFKAICIAQNIKIIRQKKMTCGNSYVLYSNDTNEFAKYDFLFDFSVKLFSFVRSEKILENSKLNVYPILDENYANFLNDYKLGIRANTYHFLSKGISHPLRLIFPRIYFWSYLKSIIYNYLKSPGKFVLLVGPDGAGKTTFSLELERNFKKIFFSVRKLHFNFNLFPRLNNLRIKKIEEPDYTEYNSGTNAPIQPRIKSIIYCLYYGIEIIITSHLIARKYVANGGLLIFDRYFHDYFFQRSYRKMPKWMVRLVLKLTFKPDLVINLTGDPELINLRKPELSKNEISIQQYLVKTEVLSFWSSVGVEIVEIDTTSNDIKDSIAETKLSKSLI